MCKPSPQQELNLPGHRKAAKLRHVIALPLIIEPDSDVSDFAAVQVDAVVAGRTYRMMLDTGAAVTQLVADEYLTSLPVVSEDTSAGAFGRKVTYPVVRIPDLAIGDLQVGALEVTCGPKLLGSMVGMDVLGRRRCHLRLEANILELDALPDHVLAQTLATDSRRHASIELSWPGITARALVDSGSPPTLVNKEFRHNYPELFTQIGMTSGGDASGDHTDTPVLLMHGPVIGGHRFTAHKVVAVDLSGINGATEYPSDLILGYSTLRQADWLFDFPGGKWDITAMKVSEDKPASS